MITLNSLEEKQSIFNNLGKIKGLVNENGKPFIFSDYLPPSMNDLKRRERNIFRLYKSQGPNSDATVEWKRGRLHINKEVYQKKVTPPTPSQILSDIDLILSIELSKAEPELSKAEPVLSEDNTFIGYTMRADNVDQINNAYCKLKLIHPDARRNVCAYSIPVEKEYERMDYCDDGEHNAGRRLIGWFGKQKVKHAVVFIVRYCGHNKLGPDRYHCILEAAKNALLKANLLQQIQQSQQSESDPAKPTQHQTPNSGPTQTSAATTPSDTEDAASSASFKVVKNHRKTYRQSMSQKRGSKHPMAQAINLHSIYSAQRNRSNLVHGQARGYANVVAYGTSSYPCWIKSPHVVTYYT